METSSGIFFVGCVRLAWFLHTPQHPSPYFEQARWEKGLCRDNFSRLLEYLCRFGSVHSWWTFPFERIIGMLRPIPTNFKIGMSCALFLS